MNRRSFLKTSGALTLVPLLPGSPRQVSAQAVPTPPGKFFVMIRAQGGWDVTLGLDPWTDAANVPDPKDMFLEYNPADLKSAGAAMKVGPSLEPLLAHAGDFSIVNGVFLSQVDNGHGASLSYISNGATTSGVPTLPVEIARSTYEGDFGVLFNLDLDMGDRAVTTSSLGELEALPGSTDFTSILRAILGNGGSGGAYLEAVKNVISSRASIQRFIAQLQVLGPAPHEPSQILAAAFAADMASSAQLDFFQFFLDTHGSHAGAHLDQQKKFWTEVHNLFTLFKNTAYGNDRLFDHTTFMVVSEFARTPALNAAGGKDHNPMTNSVLLAGRGVKGGLVVGGSRLITAAQTPRNEPYHIALPIDYSTCEVQHSRTPQAQMIFPENVAETVARIVSADRNLFHSVPAGTLPLSALIKT